MNLNLNLTVEKDQSTFTRDQVTTPREDGKSPEKIPNVSHLKNPQTLTNTL